MVAERFARLAVEIVATTDKAILVKYQDQPYWIPRDKIKDGGWMLFPALYGTLSVDYEYAVRNISDGL